MPRDHERKIEVTEETKFEIHYHAENFWAPRRPCLAPGVLSMRRLPRNRSLPGRWDTRPAGKVDRIVDMHVHFDPKEPNYIDKFLEVSDRLNLTALMLTPFANRKMVAEAAKQHPTKIVPFGYVNMDAPEVVQQVEELHAMGFRGLGELEFVKKPYIDPGYFPVYERANQYGWIVLFHTGIVLREKFDEPEDVASGRMRPIHLEEIARRFPKITVLGAHCGNPEYQWAAEVARWNSNVFFRSQRFESDEDARPSCQFQGDFLVVGQR